MIIFTLSDNNDDANTNTNNNNMFARVAQGRERTAVWKRTREAGAPVRCHPYGI